VTSDGKFFDVMLGLLKHCMPELDEGAITKLLWRRARPPTEVHSDLFQDEQVRDCFDPSDLKVVDHHSAATRKSYTAEFQEELEKRIQKSTAAAVKPKGKGKGKKRKLDGSAVVGTPATHTRRDPGPPKGDSMTESDARQYLPPGSPARIWKDLAWCDRWQVKYAPYGTLSRSFQLYGEMNALARCLNWAWHFHTLTNPGQVCPYGWVLEADWRLSATA
jgi:hypothetical protein